MDVPKGFPLAITSTLVIEFWLRVVATTKPTKEPKAKLLASTRLIAVIDLILLCMGISIFLKKCACTRKHIKEKANFCQGFFSVSV
jgi:hypothetical protein